MRQVKCTAALLKADLVYTRAEITSDQSTVTDKAAPTARDLADSPFGAD